MFQYVPHIAISDICFSSDHTFLINTVSFILRVTLSSLSIETTRRFLIMILCAINVGCVFKRSQNYTNACTFIWFYKNYTWVFDMYAALSILFISCSVSFILSFHSLSMIFRYISFGWMSSCQYWAHHQVEFACANSTKLAINIEKRHECPSLSAIHLDFLQRFFLFFVSVWCFSFFHYIRIIRCIINIKPQMPTRLKI